MVLHIIGWAVGAFCAFILVLATLSDIYRNR